MRVSVILLQPDGRPTFLNGGIEFADAKQSVGQLESVIWVLG
jgi:hypothetical protein